MDECIMQVVTFQVSIAHIYMKAEPALIFESIWLPDDIIRWMYIVVEL